MATDAMGEESAVVRITRALDESWTEAAETGEHLTIGERAREAYRLAETEALTWAGGRAMRFAGWVERRTGFGVG